MGQEGESECPGVVEGAQVPVRKSPEGEGVERYEIGQRGEPVVTLLQVGAVPLIGHHALALMLMAVEADGKQRRLRRGPQLLPT